MPNDVTCGECKPETVDRFVSSLNEDTDNQRYSKFTGYIILCPKHDRSFEKRLVEALRVYAERTTLHSVRNGWGVFNSPGPELAQGLVAEYDLREAEER